MNLQEIGGFLFWVFKIQTRNVKIRLNMTIRSLFMIKFVKGFKNVLPEGIQFVILVALSILAIVLTVWNQTRIWDFIESLLPITLIAFGVFLLQRKQQTFLAHFMLFFLFYADYFGGFFRAILSYNFGNSAFSTPLTLNLILCAVGSVYLILYLGSHILNGELKFNFKFTKNAVLIPLIAMVLYAYFKNSFLTAVIWALPVVVSLLIGSPLAAMMFLLRCFIAIPFTFLDVVFNGTLKFTTVSYWLFLLAAFYILAISVLATLKILNEPVEK